MPQPTSMPSSTAVSDTDINILEGNLKSGKIGHISVLFNLKVLHDVDIACLPKCRVDAKGGGAWDRMGCKRSAFAIVLMPEGNRDMETIPPKKSEVYTVRRKNFEHNRDDQFDIDFLCPFNKLAKQIANFLALHLHIKQVIQDNNLNLF
jgi:hypothetical protein